MADTVPLLPIRERIKDLNTKAYYLLVALSFVYRTDSGSRLLKSAFTLTAIAAVLPVQDYIESAPWLEPLSRPKSDLSESGSDVDGFLDLGLGTASRPVEASATSFMSD